MRQHIHTCFDKIVNCDYVMEYGISGIAGATALFMYFRVVRLLNTNTPLITNQT